MHAKLNEISFMIAGNYNHVHRHSGWKLIMWFNVKWVIVTGNDQFSILVICLLNLNDGHMVLQSIN